MSTCPNCDQPTTAAPWRYDDADHGVHWVCPGAEDLEPEIIYAPIPLSMAIDNYLRQHPRSRQTAGRLG
jgi:hypothetical protein